MMALKWWSIFLRIDRRRHAERGRLLVLIFKQLIKHLLPLFPQILQGLQIICVIHIGEAHLLLPDGARGVNLEVHELVLGNRKG